MLYLVNSFDVWKERLRHVSFGYIKKMKEMTLIPTVSEKHVDKCEVCGETKITKTPCKPVPRESELLLLIHSNLGDLKMIMTRV